MGELPPANTTRWVISRKAAVVDAVISGQITIKEACRRYQLSEEEFLAWQRAYEEHGAPGLRITQPKPEIADSGTVRLGSSCISAGFPPLRQHK